MRTTWLISAAVFLVAGAWPATVLPATAEKASSIFESPAPPVPVSRIDKLVFAKLSSLGIQPALCSDAVFVRRAYLDVIGTLPTAKEAREFIQDPDAKNKRRLLIDRLLERDEFADYWAMKWGDILRIKAEFPVNLWPNAAQAYHRWVRASIAENKPYDKFVREMLTSSGSNFRVGPVNFYRAIQNRTPEGIADGRGLDVHGNAGRCLAEGPAGGHGGLLLADRLQAHAGVEGGTRFLGSLSTGGTGRDRVAGPARPRLRAQHGRPPVPGRSPRRRWRPCFPTGPRSSCRPTAIRGRSSPIG